MTKQMDGESGSLAHEQGTLIQKRRRSCIACRAQDDKVRLYRFVHPKGQLVSFDPTGRIPGRGAYVCSQACFQRARASRRFEQALRTRLTDDDYNRIEEELISATSEIR